MRCKKHPTDQSCSVGVCASCLRERLVAVVAAQAQAHALKHALQDCRKSDSQLPQPPLFPRSVSPYISRRKSDNGGGAAACPPHGGHRLFYSTPQAGPHRSIPVEVKKNSRSRFASLFWGFFRSKPDSRADPVSGPAVSIDSCSASPAWFPSIIGGRRRKKVLTFSNEETAFRNRGRGVSPARQSDHDDERSERLLLGLPRLAAAAAEDAGIGAAKRWESHVARKKPIEPDVLSEPARAAQPQPPLVSEGKAAGDPRTTPKAHLSTAASFCKNRSRKLADFGRYPHDSTC